MIRTGGQTLRSRPLIPQVPVPHGKGRAQGPSCIAGSRLYPDVFEEAFSQNAAVGHAVQSHPSREAEVSLAGLPVDVVCHPQEDFLSDAWMLAAMSISLCVISASGFRGGPPKSLENRPFVMRRPPRKSK